MTKKSILIILIALTLHPVLFSQSLSPSPAVIGKWLKNWMISDPVILNESSGETDLNSHIDGFDTDFLTTIGGEEHVMVKKANQANHASNTPGWKMYHSSDSIINLEKVVGLKNHSLAYAYTEVISDKVKVVQLSFGSDDGIAIWLNGIKVWDRAEDRGVVPDIDLVVVALKKGLNTVLMKIENKSKEWGFCARFLPFQQSDLSNILSITTDANGRASLISSYTLPALQQLVASTDIEIFAQDGKLIQKENRSTEIEGPIKLDLSRFRSYAANLDILLRNGQHVKTKLNFSAGKKENYSLFSNASSAYRIALTRDASASESWAAKELQHWLKEISGVELPIQEIGQPYTGPQIVLGYTPPIKDIFGNPIPNDLDESFHYINFGPDIYIYGGKTRGTMYGVMSFLENEMGCRWYTPSASIIPKKKVFEFSSLDHSEKPGVRVRNDFYFEAFNPTWAARNRINGTNTFGKSREQIGETENYWGVHTFNFFVPVTEFSTSHPEYFSLLNGKREFHDVQLCLSNPDVLNIITDRIKKQMRENPDNLIYDVSQNDCYRPCQCGNCQAIVKHEGSESGLIIWFVNQVAEAVEKEFPDKFIGTLAYQYTRTPPKYIHPRKNVVVRLCSIECCFSHDFKSCEQNKSFLSDLKNWSTLAPHLYIWDYVVNFSNYIMPFPNFKVLQSNIQTLRDNHSIGIMEQAAYQGRGGEFAELRAYLISKLLWNPECNTDNVITDFMYGYYGRSGRFIRQYFDLLHKQVVAGTHIHLGLSSDDPIFTDDFVAASVKLFEEAARVADNTEILSRVEVASLPILYLKCKRTPGLAKFDGTYQKFCSITKREGIIYYSEDGENTRLRFHKEVEAAK
ncbi:MAG: hypothetical protein CK547_02290 [Chitinophagaceae bacterium]|nr:MAG: hypothetical protein CK547_02290 [Chitinophagaceae bacterium]